MQFFERMSDVIDTVLPIGLLLKTAAALPVDFKMNNISILNDIFLSFYS